MLIKDTCGADVKNISRTNCTTNQKRIVGFLVYRDLTKQLAYASDITKANIKLDLQAGNAYYFPRITGATDNTEEFSPTFNDYGVARLGSTAINTAIKFEIDTSNCMMANLHTWTKVKVSAFPIYEDGSIGGIDVESTYLKGQESMFAFFKAKYKTTKDDDPQNTMHWVVANDRVNTAVGTEFILDLDGVVDCEATFGTITTSAINITVKEFCNNTGVEGLQFADFTVELANGTIVAPTAIVDNTGGNYDLTVATTSGDNFVYFSTNSIALTGSDKLVGLAKTQFTTP